MLLAKLEVLLSVIHQNIYMYYELISLLHIQVKWSFVLVVGPQAWHYCDFTDGHSTFLCPNGTLFSQVLLTCDWWFNVDCKQAQQLYVLNERLYRYIKPPKPSFPEDYHGPQVDLWLLKQLELGLLPKIKKRGKVDKPVVTPNT